MRSKILAILLIFVFSAYDFAYSTQGVRTQLDATMSLQQVVIIATTEAEVVGMAVVEVEVTVAVGIAKMKVVFIYS